MTVVGTPRDGTAVLILLVLVLGVVGGFFGCLICCSGSGGGGGGGGAQGTPATMNEVEEMTRGGPYLLQKG